MLSNNLKEHKLSKEEYFRKWGLNPKICNYHFDEPFAETNISDLIKNVLAIKTQVKLEKLSTNATSLSFFSSLENDVYREHNGEIIKCFDYTVDDILISDKVRASLLDYESPEYCLFSENDRKEFIFHLFKMLSIGGFICQYEDFIYPYLDVTRDLYRDLVCVVREGDEIKVKSLVYKVIVENFPKSSEYNCYFICVDPLKKIITTLTNDFFSGAGF
jgi:hypothetical protein